MIRFDRVFKRYGKADALSDLSCSIDAGEMVYLTGHSGAGKSTFLRLIGLLERPTRGQLLVDGVNLSSVRSRQVPFHRRKVGMIFQDHRLLVDRTVFDNVALPLVIAGARRPEMIRRVRASLDLVGLLPLERSLAKTLSGGEQQRVGIARAVVARPPVVLADEPTGNLDPDLSREIMRLFERLNDVGMTLVIASHDLRLVRESGRRALVLKQGRLEDDVEGGRS